MLKKIIGAISGDPNQKILEGYRQIALHINSLEPEYEALSDEQLSSKTDEFKARLQQGETLDDILPEAFAAVREVSKRQLGQRHYDVQLIGGMILHEGQVAEMRTGEGKTLMSTLPLYLNALTNRGVHLVTVNDYLARRDARWMAPIYNTLGLSVGVLQMGSRTESGKKAFLVDLERENLKDESNHQLVLVDRSDAYAADITYGTNNEFGFDYLRDNMSLSLEGRSQRGHYYAIIDEVDNVLIDEARTPLIISGPSHDDAENYQRMAEVVKNLRPGDYEINEKDRTVVLTELGEMRVEQLLNTPLRDPARPEDVTPEQARMMGYLEQALRAQFLYKRNKEYMVQGRQVIIVDEFTGRLMPGRRWSDGLHQAVEAKENVPVRSENITHATITIQNYFRMYEKLAGMTGTALTEGEEFADIYKLEVLPVPPHVEYMAIGEDALLSTHRARDEYGYEYIYYAMQDDEQHNPVFFRRKDYPDVVFRTEEAKLRAMVQEIIQYHIMGRPTLVGTTSVEASERLSKRLRANMVSKLLQALLLRKAWFEVNKREEDGRTVMALSFLNEPLDSLNSGEMNKLAKELGISLNLNAPENIERLLNYLDLEPAHREGLVQVLKSGVTHQVLNARKHTEESRTIEKAGAAGTVTIATNMAGRGVDIKLGGKLGDEYAEERINLEVVKLLRDLGYKDPYNMNIEERYRALKDVDLSDLRLTQSRLVGEFLSYIEEMEKVKQLGGLHVIGSERHEARRIDNQLRGRAARQGDPGSSRFYLSMQDELMRLFGGQQVENMMARLGMDDALPMEARIVSNIIESSQTRVEGANFDTRKHLLEYDDVLNTQRMKIYSERDRIFVKDDLTDDVRDMLETELSSRVPQALEDAEGPWKLLSWLESVQPPMQLQDTLFPSFTIKLLLDQINPSTKDSFLDIAAKSMAAEEEHLMGDVHNTLEGVQERLLQQVDDRRDALDMFFDTLGYADPAEMGTPKQVYEELQSNLGIPITLSNAEQRLLLDDPDQVKQLIEEQLKTSLYQGAVTRLISAVERRLGFALALNANELASREWSDINEAILNMVQANFNERRRQFIGEDNGGLLGRELDVVFSGAPAQMDEPFRTRLLLGMAQGEATAFDKRTHRQVKVRINRLNYVYYAATLLGDISADELNQQVLSHMDRVFDNFKRTWGVAIWDQTKTSPLDSLDEKILEAYRSAFGEQAFETQQGKALETLPEDQQKWMIAEISRRGVTEAYRHLLLQVISQLWVEYLTQMEALRVSIGLEAYAQRDPLVQYKAQAFEMFQQLFSDMRMGVISRMFNLRPRQALVQRQVQETIAVQAEDAEMEIEIEDEAEDLEELEEFSAQEESPASANDGKRKRKRKKKR